MRYWFLSYVWQPLDGRDLIPKFGSVVAATELHPLVWLHRTCPRGERDDYRVHVLAYSEIDQDVYEELRTVLPV